MIMTEERKKSHILKILRLIIIIIIKLDDFVLLFLFCYFSSLIIHLVNY